MPSYRRANAGRINHRPATDAAHRPRGPRQGFRAPLLLLISLWTVPAALLAAALLLSPQVERESVVEAQPSTVVVGERSVDRRMAVDVIVNWSSADRILSSGDGMLTGISISPDTMISTSTEMWSVDDVPRLALREATPLYRTIQRGDAGPDVLSLSRLLVAMGLLSTERDTADRELVAAISAYQARVGVPRSGAFDPSYVVFVPESTDEVTTFVASVGDRVSVGTEVAVGERIPTSASFEPTGDGRSLSDFGEEPVKLTFRGSEWELLSTAVTADSLAQIVDLLDPVEPTQEDASRVEGAILSLSAPRSVGTVPASAVRMIGDSRGCLFTADGAALGPFAVTDVPGELGVAAVDSAAIGQLVFRDASTLPEMTLATCA